VQCRPRSAIRTTLPEHLLAVFTARQQSSRFIDQARLPVAQPAASLMLVRHGRSPHISSGVSVLPGVSLVMSTTCRRGETATRVTGGDRRRGRGRLQEEASSS